jgi:PAS domain S-box-containing protein
VGITAFPISFFILGILYVLIGVKVIRAGDEDVERGFAFFVICIGVAGMLLSGTELLRGSHLTADWVPYFLAVGSYGTPMLYAFASVAWLAFALRYVATVSVRFRSLVAAFSAPIVVFMPLATTMSHLIDGDSEAFPLLTDTVTPVLQLAWFVVAPYHFALALAGVAVVLWAVYRFGQPSVRFAALLFIGGPFWYFSNYVTAPVFGTATDVFFVINLLFGGVGFAALWQIHHPRRIHEERPAANLLGREEVVDGLKDPILAIDQSGQIADVNEAAGRLFGAERGDLLGQSLGAVAPEWMEQVNIQTTGTEELSTADGRILHTTVTPITDDGDRTFGQVAVFRDVSEDRHREQRLQVLNRVLRHNLRNEGNFIDGAVDQLADDPQKGEDYRELIHERIQKLVAVGTKARTVEKVVEADRRRESPTAVRTIVDQAVSSVAADYSCTLKTNSSESLAVVANDFVLEAVVTELVENAVEHTHTDAPEVAVSYEHAPSGALVIAVEDDGPGIPDHETAVIENGRESDLKHGSGIGLWLVKWGSERLGAEVQFETSSTGGARIVLEVPSELVVDEPDVNKAGSGSDNKYSDSGSK